MPTIANTARRAWTWRTRGWPRITAKQVAKALCIENPRATSPEIPWNHLPQGYRSEPRKWYQIWR